MRMDQTGGQEPGGAQTTPVMVAHVSALDAGDAGLAADLFAENALLTSADERLTGRSGIAGWHEDLLSRGAVVTASPSGQGPDAGRLLVDGPTGRCGRAGLRRRRADRHRPLAHPRGGRAAPRRSGSGSAT